MAIDPIMLALCKGQNDAGKAALSVVRIDTLITPFAEPVKLTQEESIALCNLPIMPSVIYCNVEGIGYFSTVYAAADHLFVGMLIMDSSVLTVAFMETDEELGGSGVRHYWQAACTGGNLNPIA